MFKKCQHILTILKAHFHFKTILIIVSIQVNIVSMRTNVWKTKIAEFTANALTSAPPPHQEDNVIANRDIMEMDAN